MNTVYVLGINEMLKCAVFSISNAFGNFPFPGKYCKKTQLYMLNKDTNTTRLCL